jgi:hypothetical protein
MNEQEMKKYNELLKQEEKPLTQERKRELISLAKKKK